LPRQRHRILAADGAVTGGFRRKRSPFTHNLRQRASAKGLMLFFASMPLTQTFNG